MQRVWTTSDRLTTRARIAVSIADCAFLIRESNKIRLGMRALGAAAVLAASLLFAGAASAQCVNPREMGLWQNEQANGDPIQIKSRMVECGDTNTQPNTSFQVTAIVKQSSGALFARSPVAGRYVQWTFNGVRGRWFEGDVWTGGYQDHMMMRAVTQGGQPALEVHIWHKSLDSKPSAWDHYVYRKIGNT